MVIREKPIYVYYICMYTCVCVHMCTTESTFYKCFSQYLVVSLDSEAHIESTDYGIMTLTPYRSKLRPKSLNNLAMMRHSWEKASATSHPWA